jgi:hypothetical protein
MKLLTGFFKFIGTLEFMSFIFLYLLNSTDWAIVMLILSICCFAVTAFIKLYLFYRLNVAKKDKQDFA